MVKMAPPPKPMLCGLTKLVQSRAAMAASTAEPPSRSMSLRTEETSHKCSIGLQQYSEYTKFNWLNLQTATMKIICIFYEHILHSVQQIHLTIQVLSM